MITIDLLYEFGAVTRRFKKGTLVFQEGDTAKFYHQLLTGEIRMFNMSEEGHEFTQGFFRDGESFGEPPLFLNTKYPASAKAVIDCEVSILSKAKLLSLLHQNFDIQMALLKALSARLHFKSMMSKEITLHDAAHRILTLIDFLKMKDKVINEAYAVSLTRQQIADLTGLRVETVIRTMKHLVEKKMLQQKGRKILR